MLGALLTASLIALLRWNAREQAALNLIKRENANIQLNRVAADIIQKWWRTLKRYPMTHKQHKMNIFDEIKKLSGTEPGH